MSLETEIVVFLRCCGRNCKAATQAPATLSGYIGSGGSIEFDAIVRDDELPRGWGYAGADAYSKRLYCSECLPAQTI